MKVFALLFLTILALTGCNQEKVTLADLAAARPPAAPAHNYSIVEDKEYGYTPALSEDEARRGVAAATLIMVRYAGVQNAKYQIYIKEGNVHTVFECAAQCKFFKMMTFVNGAHVRTDRIEAVSGTVAFAALEDAVAGQLEEDIITLPSDGRKMRIRFDEKRGVQILPINS